MYFMGFVWTLWALIDSFVIHKIDTGEAIFRVFGYALVTTAAGMFGRLAILQFKYTATEQSESAQQSVEDVLLKFALTLNSTRKILDDWHSGLTAATETVGSANMSLIGAVESTRHELSTTVTAATKAYGIMLEATQSRLQEVVKEMGSTLTAALRGAVAAGLSDFGAQTVANLMEVREATTGLVATLKRTNTGLGKSVIDLTETINEAGRGMGEATGAVSSATLAIGRAFRDMTERINSGCDSILEATRAVTLGMSGLSEVIKSEITLGLDKIEVNPRVSLIVDQSLLDNSIAPLREGLDKINSITGKIERTLDTRVPTVVPSPDDVARRLEKTVAAAVVTLNGRLEHIQQSIQDLEANRKGNRRTWFPWSGRS
jgi:hypothetical protein